MKNILFFLLLSIISCSHPQVSTEHKADQKFAAMLDSYWEEKSKLSPLDATQQGDNRYNHIIVNDQTREFRDKMESFYKKYLTDLETFDRNSFSENDRNSYDIFKFEMEIQLEGAKNNLWMIPFQQFWGLPITMGQLGAGESFQPFKTVKDYEMGRFRNLEFQSRD